MDNSSSDSNSSKEELDRADAEIRAEFNRGGSGFLARVFSQQRVAFLERAESCESARFETVRDDDFYIMLSLSKLSLNERLPGARETHLELSSRSDARSLVGFLFLRLPFFFSSSPLRASGS